MFIGPWDAGGPWNFSGIEGARRFLDRVWNVVLEPARDHTEGAQSGRPGTKGQETDLVAQDARLRHMTHATIRRVTEDIEQFKFNTIIAALMEFNNYLVKAKETAVCGTPRGTRR